MGRLTVLTLVGSLRAASINRQLAEAAAHAAPDQVDVVTYDGLDEIPFYNEDIDTDDPPPAVGALRAAVADADAVLIVTPEYNGTIPAVLTAMILCVFPIVVNVATGLATTEPELEDVMRALKASKLDILTNVGLPRTMPYFFASLKVAVTQAFVGTVIAETVASNRGIGNLMMIASSSFDVPLVFAGLLILAVLGVALYVIFSFIEVRVTGWALRKDEFAMG